jgi:hypothetical protein
MRFDCMDELSEYEQDMTGWEFYGDMTEVMREIEFLQDLEAKGLDKEHIKKDKTSRRMAIKCFNASKNLAEWIDWKHGSDMAFRDAYDQRNN